MAFDKPAALKREGTAAARLKLRSKAGSTTLERDTLVRANTERATPEGATPEAGKKSWWQGVSSYLSRGSAEAASSGVVPQNAGQMEMKASRAKPLISLHHLGRPQWAPRNYLGFASEGYIQNAICYRAIRMIAEAAASIPLCVIDQQGEQHEHPLMAVLNQPNQKQCGPALLEEWYGYLMVAGNSYMEVVTLQGQPRELYVLRPDRMQVIPGPEGWPEGYQYSVDGRKVRFMQTPDEGQQPILHQKLFHPVNDHYGLSPIEAAAGAIDTHNAAAKWNKALLDNSARPSGALVYTASDGHLNPEQYQRLRDELEENFEGPNNAGKPLLLEGGLEWKNMGLSPKDMDFIEAKHTAAREIALALGVPPMLLGIPGDNTYANYAEANRSFWRQTVLPLAEKGAKALSGWLRPSYGPDVELKLKLDEVVALAPEREMLWSRLANADFLTTNEKRAILGYPPLAKAGSAADDLDDPPLDAARGATGNQRGSK